MAIRQNKNYNFNFTLADGTEKVITHRVPLPIASEIGCTAINSKETIMSKETVFGNLGGSWPQKDEVEFRPEEGYVFDLEKIIISIQANNNNAKISYNIDKTSQDRIVVTVTGQYEDTAPNGYTVTTTLKTTLLGAATVQDSLNYLHSEISRAISDLELGKVISIDGKQGEINYSYSKDYSEKIISVLNGKKGSGNNTIKYKLTISDTDFRFKSIEIKNLVDSDVTILTDSCNYEYSYDKNEATITITRTDNQIFDSNKEYNLIVWSYVLFTLTSFESALTRCVKNLSIPLPEATLE